MLNLLLAQDTERRAKISHNFH